ARIDGMARPVVGAGTNQPMILLDRDDCAPVPSEDCPRPGGECESAECDSHAQVLKKRPIWKDMPVQRAKLGSFAKQEPESRGHQRKVDEPGARRLSSRGPPARRSTCNPEDSPADSDLDPHSYDQAVKVVFHLSILLLTNGSTQCPLAG